MKKMMITLMAMLTIAISAHGMSYEQARQEALFLTDKMAYELNLTDEQYEAAYEINLDYLMGVTGRHDVFGTYWERRNLDMSYILLDWQWNAYMAASYFYRPLYWDAGYWHFGIYARYPHRDYFYFGRPHFYVTYRGGHAWHLHGTHGYYYGHRTHFRAPGRTHVGLHDRWTCGDFRGSHRSSTRVTGRSYEGGRIGSNRGVESNRRIGSGSGGRQVEGHRSYEGRGTVGSGSNRGTLERGSGSVDRGNNRGSLDRGSSSGSFNRGNSSTPSRSFGGNSTSRSSMGSSHGSYSSSRGSYSGGSRSSSSFGSSRSSSSFGGSHSSSSFGGSRASSSFGGGHSSASFGGGSRSGGSFSGGSNGGGSNGGGSHGGGGHVGGRR